MENGLNDECDYDDDDDYCEEGAEEEEEKEARKRDDVCGIQFRLWEGAFVVV